MGNNDDDDDGDTLDFGLSTSDNYIDVEKIEEEGDPQSELSCPFCSESYSAIGMCCHIYDDHDTETKSRICPVCATYVGTNMAAHLITHHKVILKTLHKNRLSDGESRTILSLLRKELLDKHLKSLPERSSVVVSSSLMVPDPLLLSFIYNPPPADKPEIVQIVSSTETSLSEKALDKSTLESGRRHIRPNSLPDKDQEEKILRCEFVDSLLLSTILDDNL